MFCSIDGVELAGGTISTGIGLTDFRLTVRRMYDLAVQLGANEPAQFNRQHRTTEVSFTIWRIHDTISDAERFLALHDSDIAASGDVRITSTNGAVYADIYGAKLSSQSLTTENGKATCHSYRITGGRMTVPT